MAIKVAPNTDFEAQMPKASPIGTPARQAEDMNAEFSMWKAQKGLEKKPVGRPPSGKVMVTLRLDPAVVEKFKATGDGWQARMNEALKAAKV